MRGLGAAQNAFQFIQGLETIPLRLRQHNENAIKVTNFVAKQQSILQVNFPGLQSGENRRRADTHFYRRTPSRKPSTFRLRRFADTRRMPT
ncbi:PLP-dependent transferase [Bradyrhizobium iriomotense]|uniref:PLP-dependent transferase n=1 Tax=Bradyrhizobium iriomotense TaxID=441950 RepID=UPI0032AEBEED